MRVPTSVLVILLLSVALLTVLVTNDVTANERKVHQGEQGRHRPAKKQTNVVNTRDKAEEVLRRYGYLSCESHRKRKHNGSSRRKTVSNQLRAPAAARRCTAAEVREATRRYQRHYRMTEISGKLDSATMRLMSASRCGNRDDEAVTVVAKLKVTSKDTLVNNVLPHLVAVPSKMRFKRSIFPRDSFKNPPPGDAISRRKRWVANYMQKLQSGDQDHHLKSIHSEVTSLRRKRSADRNDGQSLEKSVVTWRLISDSTSNQFTINAQRMALALAFRMWSEVIPKIFYEDRLSAIAEVDILIAFGKGEHMNCANKFDGLGGQLSHAVRQPEAAEIHVDDDEHFTIASNQGTNLLKVAVHEVGHVLGLIHSRQNHSIMYAIYFNSKVVPNNNFELSKEDRKLVQSIYGTCETSFDTVFDWVSRRVDGQLIYNTYVFRDDHYWMYENRHHRPRFGDPLPVSTEWTGLPADGVGAFLHVWTPTKNETLFFRGSQYWLYDGAEDRVSPGYPRNTSNFLGHGMPGSDGSMSPAPAILDTLYFDKRDNNVYFFKNDKVYGYDPTLGETAVCCLPGYPRLIREEYPTEPGSDPLPFNLDAVYYSYADRSLYFFKGHHYWQNVAYDPLDRRRNNRLRGPFLIRQKWRDLCQVEFTT